MALTSITHIEITPGVAGDKPRIVGRRITVQEIVIWHERIGRSADEIASEYELSLGDVYAALAYYYDHREQIEAMIRSDDAFMEQLKSQTSSKLQAHLDG
jgi:uncharacterized protein (DUF433 family)